MDLYSSLLPYMWVFIAIVIGIAVAAVIIFVTAIVLYRKNNKEYRESVRRIRESSEEAQRKSKEYMSRIQHDNQMHSARFERDYEQKKALVRGNLYAPDYNKSEGKDESNG